MKYFLSLLLTILLTKAFAGNNTYLLEGTIGSYPIVMNLNYDDSTSSAAYFYKSAKKDMQLTGITVGIHIILYAERWNEKIKRNDTSETITLKIEGKGAFFGTWENNKHEKLEVSLKAVEINNVHNPFAALPYVKAQKTEDPYNYMRITAMPVVKDSVVKQGKFTLEYVHVENTGVYSLRIAGNDVVTDKINEILTNALLESAAKYFSCSSYTYTIRHLFISDDVISVHAFEEYSCGGAHPDYDNIPVNINAKTGEALALEDILYLHEGTIPVTESDEWLTYRHDIYGPALLELMKDLYPKHMKDKDPCDYTQNYIWDYPKWYLTEEGLHLSPEFPHVVAICRDPEWSVIPYKTLRKYKNTKNEISLP